MLKITQYMKGRQVQEVQATITHRTRINLQCYSNIYDTVHAYMSFEVGLATAKPSLSA